MRREQATEKSPFFELEPDHRDGSGDSGGGGSGGGWELPRNHPLGQPFPANGRDKVRQLCNLLTKAALAAAAAFFRFCGDGTAGALLLPCVPADSRAV